MWNVPVDIYLRVQLISAAWPFWGSALKNTFNDWWVLYWGPEEYEDAHGNLVKKEGPHDMLLPHDILASLYKSGSMHMLIGHGSAAGLES